MVAACGYAHARASRERETTSGPNGIYGELAVDWLLPAASKLAG
jgi:hypothetical protein